MNGIYMRKFEVPDFTAFTPIEPLGPAEINDPEFAQAIEDSELAVTGIKDGKVVGCGGVHPVDDFHGELWLRLSEDCLNYKIGTMRWLKSGLAIIEETFPFKQLNATIKDCFEVSARMIEYLGFGLTQTKTLDDTKYLIYSKRVQE